MVATIVRESCWNSAPKAIERQAVDGGRKGARMGRRKLNFCHPPSFLHSPLRSRSSRSSRPILLLSSPALGDKVCAKAFRSAAANKPPFLPPSSLAVLGMPIARNMMSATLGNKRQTRVWPYYIIVTSRQTNANVDS